MKELKARLTVKHDTTANWNAARGFVPMNGEIIVYDDYQSYEKDGETVYVPGIKIGTGNAFVQDLAFCSGADSQKIIDHINNRDIHVTLEDKRFWSNKLNIDDDNPVVDESLIFNRN